MTEEDEQFPTDRQEATKSCPACNGSGAADSGGFHPWGLPIAIPCPECDGHGVVSAEPAESPDNWFD